MLCDDATGSKAFMTVRIQTPALFPQHESVAYERGAIPVLVPWNGYKLPTAPRPYVVQRPQTQTQSPRWKWERWRMITITVWLRGRRWWGTRRPTRSKPCSGRQLRTRVGVYSAGRGRGRGRTRTFAFTPGWFIKALQLRYIGLLISIVQCSKWEGQCAAVYRHWYNDSDSLVQFCEKSKPSNLWNSSEKYLAYLMQIPPLFNELTKSRVCIVYMSLIHQHYL